MHNYNMTNSPELCFNHAKQLNRPAIFSSSYLNTVKMLLL